MVDLPQPLGTGSTSDREDLARCLDDFSRSWTENRLSEIVKEFPDSNLAMRVEILCELIKVDLEKRWKKGERRLLESYLHEFPEIGNAWTVPAEMMFAEWKARKRAGESVELREYAERFPRQTARLQELVAVSGLFAPIENVAETRSPDTTPRAAVKATEDLPEQFGRYKILRKIGHGGMGAVYLAHDGELDRNVAIKIPRVNSFDTPAVIERFYREARAAAALCHPNICPIHDVGQIDGTFFLSMGFVEGRPLSDFIRRGKAQGQRQAADLIRKIATVLAVAHRKGVVHRDLKPANIMIQPPNEPVLMDFGLAIRVDREDIRLTKSGTVVGTPAYMSPEQVGGKKVDAASDQFTLGVIFYELLTGQLPFDGPAMAVLGQILTQEPTPPSLLNPHLDTILEAICLKAMAKDPSHRYPSVSAMANALADFLKASTHETNARHFRGANTPPDTDPSQHRSPFALATQIGPKTEESSPWSQFQVDSPRVLPKHGRSWWRIPLAVGAVLLGLAMAWGVILTVRTAEGTLHVEIFDRELEVHLEGSKVILNHAKTSAPLAVGPHRFKIKVGNTLVDLDDPVKLRLENKKLVATLGDQDVSAGSFDLQRGDGKNLMKIKLVPIEPGTTTNDTAKQSVVKATEKPTNPSNPSLAWATSIQDGLVKAPDLGKAEVLYTDEFDDWKSNWPILLKSAAMLRGYRDRDSTEAWPAPITRPGRGRFFIRRNQPGWTNAIPASATADRGGPWSGENFACEVVGRALGEPDTVWGVELNNSHLQRGIGVYLDAHGKIRVHPTYTKGEGRFSDPHREDFAHTAIKKGEEFNTLLVIARGRNVELFVNGVAVCVPLTTDFDYMPATLFLFMQTPTKGEAEFERVRVYSAEKLPFMVDTEAQASANSTGELAVETWVKKLGGSIRRDLASPSRGVLEINLLNSTVKDEDLRMLANQKSLQVVILGNTQITNSGLAHLRDLLNLERLDLGNSAITDAGLIHLKKMEKLKRLELFRTKVGDDGLSHLAGLQEMSVLGLEGTQVSSRGLVHLKDLTMLSALNLSNTKVSDEGLQHLTRLRNLKQFLTEGTQVTGTARKQLQDRWTSPP